MLRYQQLILQLLLFICFDVLAAQDYSPVLPGNTSLFMIEFDGDYALHVDSVTADLKGTAYHFSKRWAESPTGCNDYMHPNWAGPKCVVSPEACYFFTTASDTVTFKPSAAKGYTWKVYTYPNGNYWEGTIADKSIQSRFSPSTVTDSVVIITLTLKDSEGNVSDVYPWGVNYIFSKNNGLFQFYTLDIFSAPVSGYYTIQGTTSASRGVQFMTPRTIYNFDIGDEFHYQQEEESLVVSIHSDIILQVIDKEGDTDQDEVTYTFKRRKVSRIWNSTSSEETYTYETDTITETHVLNLPVYYPQQAITETNPESFYYGMASVEQFIELNSAYGFRLLKAKYRDVVHDDENCWHFGSSSNYSNASFADGCGLFYKEATNGSSYTQMVYFNKINGNQWGGPLVLSNQSSQLKDEPIRIYPNPVSQGQSLHYDNVSFLPEKVVLYDSEGQVVSIQYLHSEDATVSLPKSAHGIYMVQFYNRQGESFTQKIVIE